ncbi:MAG: UMP kinase [Candidatus Micrarchaeota archaeon]
MHIVLSLGGSLVNTENGIDTVFLNQIRQILEKSEHNFAIVTGGGKAARKYANEVRLKGGNEFEADEAAIVATKENAKAVIDVFSAGKSNICKKVCLDFDNARKEAKKFRFIAMGGTIPGITTDADAALLAEAINSRRLVNISNVDAIYDSNPKENKNAKKYGSLDYSTLINLACRSDTRKAGENFVFDILACKIIARSKIEAHFVSGKNLNDLENAINGKNHNGTIVK